ncbi:MAG: UDP-N-acetylmuramoyl-tripeptide--D-alanyl-D-alanine ligase, partial [Terriglobales bacterium]
GERHDGHDFVEAALEAGACAAVVEASQAGRYAAVLQPKLRPVADTLVALQELAAAARRRWGRPVIAVTGSAGKTTTKEMIAAVLATKYRVLRNQGNLNNHIGVPLTLLRLSPDYDLAVLEMGMNHAGEIARLAAIAAPNVGVFTNVGEAHLGNFRSIDEIAEAKRELARAIPPTGTLILNQDDPRVARFGEGFGGQVIFYRAPPDPSIQLQYAGRHHQANAAAALATGQLFDVAPQAGWDALLRLEPPAGRGQVIHFRDMVLLHDCYNANPAAMEAMLEVLQETPGRRHIAVLGEMRELGAAGVMLHERVGAAAAATGVDTLIGVGSEASAYLDGARAAGFHGEGKTFPNAMAAGEFLRTYLVPGDVALFKASRAVKLEDAVALITAA